MTISICSTASRETVRGADTWFCRAQRSPRSYRSDREAQRLTDKLFDGEDIPVRMALWVLVGSRENWSTALRSSGIWGVRPSLEGEWNRLVGGDFVIFYCTAPISGVIGAGRVTTKFKQDTPLWPDEVDAGKVIYRFRFEFKTEYLVPESEWKTKQIKGSDVGLTYPHISKGLSAVSSESLRRRLEEGVLSRFGIRLETTTKPPPEPELDHKGVQQMIFELGTLQRFLSHKEYPMGRER